MVGGGSHPLDILRWLVEERVVEAKAFSNHVAFPQMKHDDCVVAIYRFEGGCIAKVAAAFGCVHPYAEFNHLTVYGTKGSVNRGRACFEGEPEELRPLSAEHVKGHPFDPQTDHFLRCIVDDRQPLVDAVEGANSAAPTIIATEAAKTDTALKVPLF